MANTSANHEEIAEMKGTSTAVVTLAETMLAVANEVSVHSKALSEAIDKELLKIIHLEATKQALAKFNQSLVDSANLLNSMLESINTARTTSVKNAPASTEYQSESDVTEFTFEKPGVPRDPSPQCRARPAASCTPATHKVPIAEAQAASRKKLHFDGVSGHNKSPIVTVRLGWKGLSIEVIGSEGLNVLQGALCEQPEPT